MTSLEKTNKMDHVTTSAAWFDALREFEQDKAAPQQTKQKNKKRKKTQIHNADRWGGGLVIISFSRWFRRLSKRRKTSVNKLSLLDGKKKRKKDCHG